MRLDNHYTLNSYTLNIHFTLNEKPFFQYLAHCGVGEYGTAQLLYCEAVGYCHTCCADELAAGVAQHVHAEHLVVGCNQNLA